MIDFTRAERKLLDAAMKPAEGRTGLKWLYSLPIGFGFIAVMKSAITLIGWIRGGDIIEVLNGFLIATFYATLAFTWFFFVRMRLTTLSLVGKLKDRAAKRNVPV